MVSGNNTVPVNGKERACPGPVRDLPHSYACDGANGHRVSPVLACNVVHSAKSQVAVALGVCGSVVDELEGAQLVRPSRGGEKVEAEGNEWDEVFEDGARACVWEPGVDAAHSFFDVADCAFYYMDMHAWSCGDLLDS